ncbi:MAG: [FeFe] hydrogenase H-cluster radical SAM maturase HydG [Eubacteriales bacterium]|nr:[FeFe] hydrogenase H-cluster radical SAM maturase HydG [Eubacteriales bacterium]
MIINDKYIKNILTEAENATDSDKEAVLAKAENREKLSHMDIAILLNIDDEEKLSRIFKLAGKIKNEIYGNRVVIFAPLYISDYCVNNCVYCGYKCSNKFKRRKLSIEEIQKEVEILENRGHKRLALEFGEDYENCPIEYILDAIDAVYSTKQKNGEIRRVNINIAATSVENYRKLKEKGIGTYILFQETYHRETYEKMHPNCIKGDYEYHLTAFDRAMQGGIDDVGAGVLFGLYDYKYEVLSLMIHNEHLEKTYGAGFHTISVPRLKPAMGNNSLKGFPYLLNDEEFKKVIAIIRISVPYTGMILSTRETAEFRKEAINYGISQISAGSATGVGAYKDEEENLKENLQFEVSDNRKVGDVILELMRDGFIPSYCTACYRMGRTGDRFFELARSGEIKNVCQPNAIMTLLEYICDYGTDNLKAEGMEYIQKSIDQLEDEKIKEALKKQVDKILQGDRDLYF